MNPVSCMEPWARGICQVVSPQHSDLLPPQAEQTSASGVGNGGHFDSHKSTKGASKMRRDLINSEIAVLRELLPLPASTRQRLSQLQLMALVCVYVRKANYFQQVYKQLEQDLPPTPSMGFTKAMNGFLLITCQNGKLLYISENAAEYLGHSMEDLLIHGDSVYDIIDKQDQQSVQNELLRGSSPTSAPTVSDTRHFLCRINVSRNARRQMRFGDQKLVLVRGQYHSYLPLCSRNEPVFVALCTPVVMPETRECVAQAATNLFTSTHTMDMKFLTIDQNGEHHLEYRQDQIKGLSWYQLLHWSNMKEVQEKHKLMVNSEQDRCSVLLLRLQTRSGQWLWCHCVFQVKEPGESSQQSIIVCTCQALSEEEAAIMKNNSWLYQYYSMQGKVSYGYGYDSASHTAGAYYPHMYGYSTSHMAPQSSGAALEASLGQHAYLQHHHAQVQNLQTHMYHNPHNQYLSGTQQHHQIQPLHDNLQQTFTTAGNAYQQMTCHNQFNSAGVNQSVDLPAGYWPRYEHTSTSSNTASYQSLINPEQVSHCLPTVGAVSPSIESPLKRPPTPPESPQHISVNDSRTHTEPGGALGTLMDSNQTHDPLPPLKRRLIAYHQTHNQHNSTTFEPSCKNDTSYSSPASTWATRGSDSSNSGSHRMLADTYTFNNNQNNILRGAVTGSTGSQLIEAEDQCITLALGSGHDSHGTALVARPAPVRVARQMSQKLSIQNAPPTPELDSTQNESAATWILSPPWSEGNQLVSEVSSCGDAGTAMTSHQTSVSAAIRSLDVLTAEQRLVMTASWADASLMYPFYIATPSPSSGSSEDSHPASTWRDTHTSSAETGQSLAAGTHRHCNEYQYSSQQRHPLRHQTALPSSSSSVDSPSYHTLESRSRHSGHAQL